MIYVVTDSLKNASILCLFYKNLLGSEQLQNTKGTSLVIGSNIK